MDRAEAIPLEHVTPATPSYSELLGQLLVLALPVILEQLCHTVVGLTDTWLANNLPRDAAPAAAAVGTISYITWFVGLIVGAVGTGSTALISRAKGARHRRLANSVAGQSIVAAAVVGIALGSVAHFGAMFWVRISGLEGQAAVFALSFLKLISFSLPFMTVLFAANACLRGAGDTLTPAIAMILVDVVNVICSFGLTYGKWGFPRLGFSGIASRTRWGGCFRSS
jgi:Na+-driven multidrug efflux pump